jgi:hypothetical protein
VSSFGGHDMISPSVASEFRLALNARCHRAVKRLTRAVDHLGQYRRLLRTVFWLLFVLVLISIALDYGAWRREDTSSGPFRTAARWSDQYAVDIGGAAAGWFRIRLLDGGPAALAPSGVRLSQNGRAIPLPADPRPQVSLGAKSSFGVLQRELTFALPKDVANDDRLRISATYAATYHRSVNDIILTCFILITVLRLILARRRLALILQPLQEAALRAQASEQHELLTTVLRIFPWVSIAIILGCIGYAITIGYGIFAGHALPTATAFHLLPRGFLSGIEPYFPVAILAFAAAGTLLAWGASFRAIPSEPVRNLEQRLARIWGWWALPVVVCLLLLSLSAGGWSGNIRLQDHNYASLAGFIPHSDARAYFTDAYQLMIAGDWGVLGSRRPVAEAFRQLTVVAGGYTYVGTLLVQAGLIALAMFFAARSVVLRYGIWAGIAFVGLIYLVTRAFLFTTLTEPAGLVWALVAVAFLLEAFRLNSLPHALVALAALTIALVSRMGSMFTIPILVLWLAYAYATSWPGRIKVFAGACATIACVLALNAVLASLYASPLVATGSNFAYILCGLSLGANWSDCSNLYSAELRTFADEQSVARYLFTKAWQNFIENPTVLLSRLVDNALSYFRTLPRFLFEGYSPGYVVSNAVAKIALVGLLASSFVLLWLRGLRLEILFWALLFIGVGASAAIILPDDGWRTLHVTHVLVACFFASGFSSPATVVAAAATPGVRWQTGVVAIAVVGAVFVITPKASNFLFAERAAAQPKLDVEGSDDHVVLGGRHLAGFLVMPDGDALPNGIPALHRSGFAKAVRFSAWEADFGSIIDDALPTEPFAFVMGARPHGRFGLNIYVAPASVLTLPHVCAWRFVVRSRRSSAPTSFIFFDVVRADEFPIKQRCAY